MMCRNCQRLTLDRASTRQQSRSPFIQARKIEIQYATKLRKVARHIGDIVQGFDLSTFANSPLIRAALERYAAILEPWANSVGRRMIAETDARDRRAWATVATKMGQGLQLELRQGPTGQRARELLADQVKLIKSIPLEAAERVHRLTLEGIENGTRAAQIAKEIARSGEVSKSKANLIARTEVARTSSVLTQARAEHIGSTGYIWRTAHDRDVRPSHRKMEGRFVAWDEPPTLDGMTGHAGCFPNCRCYAEPVIPER